MLKRLKGKKAQEEMVGFVLVVILVAVVFLVFLGVMIRQKPAKTLESKDMEHFLSSLLDYTSNCSISADYKKMSDLIGYCYEFRECDSGISVCAVANETMKNMLDVSFPISQDSVAKGYLFTAIYSENASNSKKESILRIEKGNCSSTQEGADIPYSHRNGIINNEIKICY
ncbi:hypothetical protein J4217_00440 [Candidatus Pacearchaeota archaeon]|nr:hypothetical protein [Candidatus Pacearchaeota archaeon]